MSHSRTWKQKWARIATLDGREFASRARQELSKRLDFATSQIGLAGRERIWHGGPITPASFFFKSDEVPGVISLIQERLPGQAQAIVSRANRICEHRFDLLGYQNFDCGRNIDWSFEPIHGKRAPLKPWYKVRYLDFHEVGDAKVTWELNRHQHLVTLAKAFRLSADPRFSTEIGRQWYDWQSKNPYPLGINWASSLEVGFRSLSWLWIRFLMDGTAVSPTFNLDMLSALATSGRHIEKYLSTYFSPNTHLLGEGVALFFIGTLCPELRHAKRWQEKGWRIIQQEAERQIQADGVHFEQSTYYHVYALDFFLHASLLATRNGIVLPTKFQREIESMLEALCFLSQAGSPPRFGDDDGGRLFDAQRNSEFDMLDPLATGAALFSRPDFKAASSGLHEEMIWLLGEAGVAQFDRIPEIATPCNSRALASAGWYAMATAHPVPTQVWIDAGSLGAYTGGHGHADALSLQLIANGKALLLDPGTFEYVDGSDDRDQFRGTAVHNTMVVDHVPQAQPKGPFAWRKLTQTKAEKWLTGNSFDLFIGSHDGYQRLDAPVTHRRHVFHLRSDFYLIRDLAEGAGKHHLSIGWHLGSDLRPRPGKRWVFENSDGLANLAILSAAEQTWTSTLDRSFCSPAYGRKEPSCILHFATEAELPSEHLSLVLPIWDQRSEVGSLRHVSANSDIAAYAYEVRDVQHGVVFAGDGKAWAVGNWGSDADVLYYRSNPSGLAHLVFCNGSYVDFSGNRVLSANRRITVAEVICTQEQAKVISPERELITLDSRFLEMGQTCEHALRGESGRNEIGR